MFCLGCSHSGFSACIVSIAIISVLLSFSSVCSEIKTFLLVGMKGDITSTILHAVVSVNTALNLRPLASSLNSTLLKILSE